ncbi:MAG: hypothetical protein WCZ89_01335 [Phycisphaerae bacterium]
MATMLKIVLLVGGLSSLSLGLIFLDQYVKDQKKLAEKTAVLELIDPPPWVSEQLKQKIYAAARAGGEDLSLREDAAEAVQKNIESHIVWLSDVQVQSTSESLRIFGQWKRPLAGFEFGGERFYICSDYFVLDAVPVPALPIVEIKGLSIRRKPSLGIIWRQDDMEAAVELLDRLDKMDAMVSSDKPLLFEIESIDVSNLDGRVDKSKPHIILTAKNGTEIRWGAKLGAWQRHLEATDKDKIANLYEYYRRHGTLSGAARYINLQYPQSGLPQPVDRF